ncbi:HoxN/HupN/NixA family nickel/cobalt transporter [Vibrio zhugei]|uniref:Nickel/cobalt efflux system n=1 Tax=Vibrio zhugei TaxID=2479546 RepID=A0ABV7C9B0_9VIBR|nr:hypothetical protein [Vibrio zhugei]
MLATLKSDIRGSIGLFSVVVIANILIWDWALIAFAQSSALFAMASMSWMLGIRHALSPIHVAVIQNSTRKLMQNRAYIPVNVGTYFSLGHATMIILITIIVSALIHQYPAITQTMLHLGHNAGHFICGSFLLTIATLNGIALRKLWKNYRHAKKNTPMGKTACTPLAKVYTFLDKRLKSSKQMYFIGFIFGLCAMTTTELSVMSIAMSYVKTGISITTMIIFSALFTLGMLLVDSINNIAVGHAYRWTLDNPFLKLYYNTALTVASIIMAIYVGTLCLIYAITQYWPLNPSLSADFTYIAQVTQHIGLMMIVTLLIFWIVAFCHYRWRGYYHRAVYHPQ